MEKLLEENARLSAERAVVERKIHYIEKTIDDNLEHGIGELSSMDKETIIDDLTKLILKKKELSLRIFQLDEEIRKKIPVKVS